MTAPERVGAGPGFAPGALTVHHHPDELAKVTRALRATGRRITLVPTMGALHEGHLELIRRARRDSNSVVVVSIFVNPLQFGPGEDFTSYPRTFETDVEACRAEGVELVFAPDRDDVYGPDPQITVHPGPLGDELEGASRPGHFAGVLTIVAKLLGIVRPDLALFGEKDYQQLVLIRRMARELNIDTAIQGIPIVRAPDGLALSSRNVYLSEEERGAALALSAALAAGAHAGREGAEAVLRAAREVLATEPLVRLDYLELRDTELGAAPAEGEARLLVAAKVGETRLIDNALVLLGDQGDSRP
ncbi:pantothenate synthetase [Saccharopolyspora erythraea NRRL 2338]|uniref:Pantothenate synthetase n=2 Tax=Saccharopolyspora erythraea TaxID=1836 RepID=PANC_SACEN|nr:pantoate--beta-alanine ligase [Saccharopolyspora erythraea]A4F6T0.1 RecName: Full=Pantothenate synthetase; Short=PS; AltName: Full=Pantoate--beta-alanine ligase; AltName: Full=Pantoate-activating enzyme [Saccharopolyspora erythraea NRRL 2338]EQD87285.1 pantoate--beta-alanine ligase [Saccharopolyspora erythraea D]PFG93557.1 pantothenate synthetase [Saccharopolyspora erythraea NRRL 2338]QRK90408.1 pantoate--beta-alanine ligase [Saccharopolyspora erythraea]CAL99754.1 pantoate--beta-alanine lig